MAMPSDPPAVTVSRVVVAWADPPPPVMPVMVKRSAVWPLALRMASGVALVLVASIVRTVFEKGEVVPIVT